MQHRFRMRNTVGVIVVAIGLSVFAVTPGHAAPLCNPTDPNPPPVCNADPNPSPPTPTPTASNIVAVQWGASGDIPVPGRYLPNSAHDDLAVWRPYDGVWYVKSLDTGVTLQKQWGLFGDVPLRADFDGDGRADFVIWRPSNGTWFVINSSTGASRPPQQWGQSGDIPVGADITGDGHADFVIWRPSNGTWYVIDSVTGTELAPQQWGQSGDVPLPGGFDGFVGDDYVVWRPQAPSSWWVRGSSKGGTDSTFSFGQPQDLPAPVFSCYSPIPAVWRPSTGVWYLRYGSPVQLGTSGDIPVAANYSGATGLYIKADLGVWRPSNGTWYYSEQTDGCIN